MSDDVKVGIVSFIVFVVVLTVGLALMGYFKDIGDVFKIILGIGFLLLVMFVIIKIADEIGIILELKKVTNEVEYEWNSKDKGRVEMDLNNEGEKLRNYHKQHSEEGVHGDKIKKKKIAIIVGILILASVVGIYCFNQFQLQSPMNDVLEMDYRNNEIEVSVHFGNYVNPSILVFDLKSVSTQKSMADVFRVFLQFAEAMKERKFDTIELSYRGKTKFKIDGNYFQTLGEEYSWQNPVYTMRTFSENLKNPDGTRAYPEWTGGLLGVTKEQMEYFNDFHMKWYLEDLSS